ncbi:histidine kinase, partial [Pseudomonas sp. FW305-BF6]
MALLAAVAVLLASTLLFLYLKSSSNETSTYAESRDLIGRIKQLNAQWETEILKARIAISHNYDPLVTPLSEMTRLWQRFESMESN